MKKQVLLFLISAVLLFTASGCSFAVGDIAGLSVVYLVTVVAALVILLGYTVFAKRKDRWYVVLFCAVFVVNCGYLLLSLSKTLDFALWANRISYLGSVFLPMSLTMIVFDTTRLKYPKWLWLSLVLVGVVVFAVTASPGIVGIYYKSQQLVMQDGVCVLVKEYGPLHAFYSVYLIAYFVAMVWAVVRSYFKNKNASVIQVVMLSAAAFINIIVWFIEKFFDNTFEMLSVSYVICELFVIGLYAIASENERLQSLVKTEKPSVDDIDIDKETIDNFNNGIEALTNTERTIFDRYVLGSSTKEIMSELAITENTLKFHNKNIYGKLGVPSRKRLIEIYNYLNKK